MSKLDGLKDAAKSAALVWLYTTIGLWIPGLLGWINEVTKWADQKGAPPFPNPTNLAFLFVSALTAAFPAAVALGIRLFENVSGVTILPRTSETPTKNLEPVPAEPAGTVIVVQEVELDPDSVDNRAVDPENPDQNL